MGAIFRHELRSYFHSLTAYVFGAFLLAVVGLGSVLYNLQAAVSNFEFVLSFASIIFVVIVPILTMRTMARNGGSGRTSCSILCPSPPRRWYWVSISPFLWCT